MYNSYQPVFGNALGESLNPFFEAKAGKRKHAQNLQLTEAMAAGNVAGMPGQGGGMPGMMEAGALSPEDIAVGPNPFADGNGSQLSPELMLKFAPMLMGLPPVA